MARKRTREPGLVLPVEAAQSVEAQTFPGFPGVFTPGEPVALSDLELSAEDAAAMVEEMGLPLLSAETKVSDDDEPEAPQPEVKETPTRDLESDATESEE